MLDVDRLREMISEGTVDTVVVAFTDMQGRLQGKRIHAPFFVDEVLPHGTEGCNYLLAVDVDMNTVGGYAMSLVGDRLRRHGVRARPRHAAAAAVVAGHRDGAVRPGGGRRARRRAVAAPGARPPGAARRRARVGRAGRHRAWSSWCSTTPTSRRGTPGTSA
ncbi:hypothetical protein GCM10025868_39940 [Angustibacter aerolatus]|uniref:Glutamine synthetase n=1 Tax=Angustibacter aerolatus TaxID=1162965 RepID=A0ABQ6JNQ1_9ACTN|nr:hypothetical protein GCM10025868_39940 [Angustibacter aerolatus]